MSKTPSIDVRFRANKYELDIFAILESIPADIKNEFIKECIVEHTKAVVNGKQKSRILSRQVLCNELTDKQADLSFYVPSRDMILSEMERDYLSPKAPTKEFVYIQQEQETTTKTNNNNNSAEDNTDTDANTNTDADTDTDTDANTNTDTDINTNTDALDESIAVTRDDDCDNNNNNNDNDNNDDNDDNDDDNDDYDMSNYSTFGMQGTSIF